MATLPNCSTRRADNRPRPVKILACPEVVDKIEFRNQFYDGLRGRLTLESKGYTVDSSVALSAEGFFRFEISGPLGITLGLFVRNADWVHFFVPREKKVFRFPSTEWGKNTLRRERFLSLLPFPVEPQLSLDALLSRVSGLQAKTSCEYDAQDNLYWLRVPQANGGSIVGVDPTDFYPQRIFYFDSELPALKDKKWDRHLTEFRLSDVRGQGAASFPLKVWMGKGPKTFLRVTWKEAEIWKDPDVRVFSWQPNASWALNDY